MSKFVIAPHMRLQESVVEEKGYFAAEDLDYEFRDELVSQDGKRHDLGDKVGAFQTFEKGRSTEYQLRLPLDRECRGIQRAWKALRRRLFGVPRSTFVPPDSGVRGRRYWRGGEVPFRWAINRAAITPPSALEQYLHRRMKLWLLRRPALNGWSR